MSADVRMGSPGVALSREQSREVNNLLTILKVICLDIALTNTQVHVVGKVTVNM